MFDAIGNMPLHPLVIHAVVIGIPLGLLLAVLFAFPPTRRWARWPLAVVVLGSFVSTFVAKESGEGLRSVLNLTGTDPVSSLIRVHSQLAGQLLLIMAAFTVIALVNVFVVPRRRTAQAPEVGAGRRVLSLVLLLALVVVGGVAGYLVYRVGDIGSRAVWNPTGTSSFSATGGH